MLGKLGKFRLSIYGILNLLFLIVYLFIVVAFFFGKIFDAFHKPFWIDEIFGLSVIRSCSYTRLLFCGAPGEGSSAPLDYIACKVLDQIKENVSYFGFTPEIYFRLFANGITAFSALVILFLFKKGITNDRGNVAVKTTQLFLLLCLLIAYLFRTQIYYFAAEIRPYALWNSLFIIALATSFSEETNKKFFFFSLILVAFSATAAIFQISTLAAAYFVVRVVSTDKVKKILKDEARLFAIPFFVVLYYCLRAGKWNFVSPGENWENFISLWKHKLGIIPLMLSVITACFLKKENNKYAVAALAFLMLFLIGPLIFLITTSRGFFYAERQYIYYELSTAVFIMTLIKCIPAYTKKIKSKSIISVILITLCLIGASSALKSKYIKKFKRAAVNILKVSNGDFNNNSSFRKFLRNKSS